MVLCVLRTVTALRADLNLGVLAVLHILELLFHQYQRYLQSSQVTRQYFPSNIPFVTIETFYVALTQIGFLVAQQQTIYYISVVLSLQSAHDLHQSQSSLFCWQRA